MDLMIMKALKTLQEQFLSSTRHRSQIVVESKVD